MPCGKFDSINQKHYPDLVVPRHQYGISALVFQTSFGGEASGSVAKCRLFSEATNFADRRLFWLELNSALGLVWFSNLQLHWKFLRLFETIRARVFFCFVFLARALFYGARRKNKPVKIAKNDFRYPLEPRYIEGPRDLGFVISRSFSMCYYY